MRSCDGCTLCCDLLEVEPIGKRAGARCEHCRVGAGCAIYNERPPVCRTFDCGWRLSPGMAESLRPDRCGVVFEAFQDEQFLSVAVDPARPLAWRDKGPKNAITGMVKRGYAVGINVPNVGSKLYWPEGMGRVEAERRLQAVERRVRGSA